MELILLIIILCLVVPGAVAQTPAPPDAHSLDLPMAAAYVWVAIWGAVGGLVSFYQKVRTGSTRWLNINELIGEIMTSAFVGLGTGLLCVAAGAPAALTYALVGVTGHMGGRAIFWAEKALQQWAEKRFGVHVSPLDMDPIITARKVVEDAAALAAQTAQTASMLAAATAGTARALDQDTTVPGIKP